MLSAPTDVKLGKLLSIMGVDHFTYAVHELFLILAQEANVKPETLKLTTIPITSSHDKTAALATKIFQDTFKLYIKSAQQSAKEIERHTAKQTKLEKATKGGLFSAFKGFFEKKGVESDRGEGKSSPELKQEVVASKEESEIKPQSPKSGDWKEKHKGMVFNRDEISAKPSVNKSQWLSAKPNQRQDIKKEEEEERKETDEAFKH